MGGRISATSTLLDTWSRARFRGFAVVLLALMTIANTALAVRSFRLEDRLERERHAVADLEETFMGSAFVVDDAVRDTTDVTGPRDRRDQRLLLVTNRHVARPWESEVASLGERLEPVLLRFVAYRQGSPEAVPVTVAAVSETADVAVLRADGLEGTEPIPLAAEHPEAGDEVLLLGFPTGLRALIARAEEDFVDRLFDDASVDGWQLVERLAEHGHISPLATRGMVGHTDDVNIVYDAETATGGSGGPLLNLAGEAVAVNAALLPRFGGSNLGVPIAEVRALLAQVGPEAPDALVPPASMHAPPVTRIASAPMPDWAGACSIAAGFCDSPPGAFPLP